MTDADQETVQSDSVAENPDSVTELTTDEPRTFMSPLKARLIGLFLLLAGIASCIGLKVVYEQGASVYDWWIILTPALCAYGLAGFVYPPVIQQGERGKNSNLPWIVSGVGLAIGFILRAVVFRDWHKH
jgi:hypothetical protein